MTVARQLVGNIPFFGGGDPIGNYVPPVVSAVAMNYAKGSDLPAGTIKLEAVTSPALTVSALSIRVGPPDKGLLFPCERVGSTNVWRMTGTWDTTRQLDPEYTLVVNYVDDTVWCQAIATTPNGTITSDISFYVFTDNKNFRGQTPTYQSSFDFQPPFTTLDALRSYYNETSRESKVYGTEDGVMTMVNDPGNTSTTGAAHLSYGNVLFSSMQPGYKAQTANRTINGRTYGPNGDQAATGGQRVQFQSPKEMDEGTMAYYGQAWREDVNMKFPTTSHISRGQVFGNPYEIGLLYMLDGQYRGAASEHSDAKLGYWQYWGGRMNPYMPLKAFEMPISKGNWVATVVGVGFSRDPRKGWIELAYRHPDINNGALTRVEFFGVAGNYRLPVTTLPPGNTGYAFHTQTYAAEKLHPIPTHFAKMRVAGTLALADPGGY